MSSGRKNDKGKAPIHHVWSGFTQAVALVMGKGADKYEAYNWRKGLAWSRVWDAANRHLQAFWEGEDNDPETGYSHLAHAGANIMMLIWHVAHRPDLDDRYKPEASKATEAERVHHSV